MDDILLYRYLPLVFYYAMFVITLFLYSKIPISINTGKSNRSLNIGVVIAIIFAFVTIAFLPYLLNRGSDRENYAYYFLYNSEFDLNDYAWLGLISFVRLFTSDVSVYFNIVAALYVGIKIYACRYLCKSNAEILAFALLISFMFYSYGTNTMRAGLASSIVILAMGVFARNKLAGAMLALLSVFTHHSMAIPMAAFVLAYYKPSPKWYFRVWVFSILLSAIAGNTFAGFLGNFVLENAGEQAGGYILEGANESYKSGFRVDFILYSLVPIWVGYRYLYKYMYQEKFYQVIYSTYLLANTFFILVIRANYIDRFGYLSWMLMPIVLLYPLLNSDQIPNRGRFAARTVVLLEMFTFLMFLRDQLLL